MERWRRLNGQSLDKSLMDAVEETIIRERAAGHRLKVCIGTDSQQRQEGAEFATVIVFLREKRGGFMFIKNWDYKPKLSLKERMRCTFNCRNSNCWFIIKYISLRKGIDSVIRCYLQN